MDLNIIKELICMAKSNGVSALEVEENGFRVRVENGAAAPVAPVVQPVQLTENIAKVNTEVSSETAAEPALEEGKYDYIKSPMVGIFNSLEKLGRKPLNPGDKITPETVICGIEAMKMMCDIEAETSGELVEFMCSDGDQVEFGQLLAKIKK